MKKSIALILVALIAFSAIACTGSSKLIGTWVLDSGGDEETASSVELMKAFGMEMSIEFKSGGKGIRKTVYGDEVESAEFTYEFKDGKVIVDGANSEGSLRLEGNKLIMETEGMQLIFKKK